MIMMMMYHYKVTEHQSLVFVLWCLVGWVYNIHYYGILLYNQLSFIYDAS